MYSHLHVCALKSVFIGLKAVNIHTATTTVTIAARKNTLLHYIANRTQLVHRTYSYMH